MKITLSIMGCLLLSSLLAVADAGAVFDLCGDCEREGGGPGCGSALSCMNKLPGSRCANDTGRCKDLEHEDCEDEPQTVCCGCDIYTKSWYQGDVFEPSLPIPDGDPGGIELSLDVPVVVGFDFIEIRLELDHPRLSDLAMTLTHAGQTITLMSQPSCDALLSCVLPLYLSDVASAPIQCEPANCEPCFPGGAIGEHAAYSPMDPLALFDGFDTFGPWILNIADTVPGAAGGICAWELSFAVWDAVVAADCRSWSTIKSLYR